ncbi:hypothetical protein LTR36_007572 [Oleoguttula mirabilis]|uniref:ARID domain-containing protein n=1 Tax=Oleoguttula mirabilis TaxID=1507867 RepID=A0AAV9JUH3_9PEZI|nr:hypothetical protein LTR36_007572 [Oleoguttula mirabilis]
MQQWASGHLNPASMYSHLANPNQFDVNNQYPQGFPNGSSATPTPGFSNQTFQPGSVIPAKRPHDGMSGSPHQPQPSRSQTPSYGGFPNQQTGGPQFPNAPTPYQHLQQPGSSTATPSPTMQNQQFRQPAQPQRMQNASPSPFPQQPVGFGNHVPPSTPQQSTQPSNLSQQGQVGGWNQGMGMNPNNMAIPGMQTSMPGQMSNMMAQPNSAQRQYQMKLLQQQDQMRRSGMVPPRNVGGQPTQMSNFGGQQAGGNVPNGQMSTQMAMVNHQKRTQFLKTLQAHSLQQGRPFNPTPVIGGRQVDLFMLWSVVAGAGGSQNVERQGQWQAIANKIGFSQPQFPSASEELKQLYIMHIANYERMWYTARAQAKQEQARVHAHQMAGLGGPAQASPTKTMQPPSQQNQYSQFQQGQHAQPQPQATPVQANAQLPQNGMSTPQQMLQHRRNSSIRKPEQMTPQTATQAMTAPSPHSAQRVQSSPSVKQEAGATVMKSDEPQSTNYEPHTRTIEYDGGYDISALYELGTTIARAMPNMPSIDEMGVIDMRAITRSLESGINAEVRYALDALTLISRDERIHFELEKCEDLLDIIVDRAEEQIEMLSEEAAEVSDALDLPSYEDIMRGGRAEAETLQEVPEFGTQAYELDRAADRVIAITTIMRNFSFYEHNHQLLTSVPLIKWLSNTIRLLGTRNMLLRTFYNALDFYKDMITFLSNITQSLELPGRDDALHILHFLLAFAPQPSPSYTESGGKVRFTSFVPAVHRFLPPAVDCLAKLLARQDPNRMLYRSIFTASSASLAVSESPLDLLTRAFALSISVLPDRSKGSLGNATQLRIVEARKSYLCQGMLAADILTSLAPGNDTELARAWIESEDGWPVGLLNLTALLSVDRSQPTGSVKGQLGHDTESFKLITHRALSMMKRLAEKAGKGTVTHVASNGVQNGEAREGSEAEVEQHTPRWEGIPQGHAILGALMMPNTDKVALGLLCGLHEMAMQT